MSKAGKAFESEIIKSLNHIKNILGDSFVFRRIQDTSDFAVNWCPNCRTYKKSKLILGKNPADFVYTYCGKTTYIEAKSSMAKRYQLSWIKLHQVEDLIEHKLAGCNGFILISYRASLAKRRGKIPVFDKNRCWRVEPEDILRVKESGVVSLSWDEVDSLGVEVFRVKGVWLLMNI